MPKKPKVSGREAAIQVLREAGRPMKASEIAAAALELVKPKMKSKTPEATITALVYKSAAKGETFRKTGRGEFELIAETQAEPAGDLDEALKQEAKPARKSRKKEPESLELVK